MLAAFLGTPRYNAVSLSANGKVYLGTGFDGWVTNDWWEYSPLVGQEELSMSLRISVYPNPASDKINITCGDLKMEKIKIYDLSGKTVLEKNIAGNSAIINISALDKGVYFLEIKTGSKTAVKKLAVE